MSNVLRDITRLEGEITRIQAELSELRRQVTGSAPRQRRTQSFTRPPPAMIDPAGAPPSEPAMSTGPVSTIEPARDRGPDSSDAEALLGPPPPPPPSVAPSRPSRSSKPAPIEKPPSTSDLSHDPRITPSRRAAVQAGRYEFVGGEGRKARK